MLLNGKPSIVPGLLDPEGMVAIRKQADVPAWFCASWKIEEGRYLDLGGRGLRVEV